jgi:hypothetical protein
MAVKNEPASSTINHCDLQKITVVCTGRACSMAVKNEPASSTKQDHVQPAVIKSRQQPVVES